MSQYFNTTRCGGIANWGVLEGTYPATPTGTPFTIYLDTNTGTYTGYSSLGAAFPLGSAVGGGLTPAQLTQLNQATTDNTTQTSQITALQTALAAIPTHVAAIELVSAFGTTSLGFIHTTSAM